MKINHITFILIAVVTMTSCDKLLEFEPGDVVIAADALQTADDAQRMLNSNYDVLGNLYDGRVQNVGELLTENLAIPENNNDYVSVWNRETNFFTSFTNGVYTDFYRAVYRGNALLDNFDLIEDLSSSERTRMEAEVRFIRALCHFQVVKLWAQPYNFTADNGHLGIPIRRVASQEPLPRSTVKEVYDFIIEDLEYARANLPLSNDVYANRHAASALLAMVYFQMSDYASTVSYANEVIGSNAFSLDLDLDRYEQDAINSETIFGIVSNILDIRSEGFRDNYRSDNNANPTLTFSSSVVTTLQQTPSDARNDWYSSDGAMHKVTRFNGKEYYNIPVIHLTGLMLMRAEALGHLNQDLEIAIADINSIRDRAFGEGLFDVAADASGPEVVDFARLELWKETLCEGTWIDHLKRRGTQGEAITVRNAPWDCPGMALQFPNGETSAAGFILNEEGGCN